MSPATFPRDNPLQDRLLYIDAQQRRFADARVGDLPSLLREGDLLVVNDGATLPASLRGATDHGEAIEARLITMIDEGRFSALLFGGGDWRTRTEDRPAPPRLDEGRSIVFGEDLSAVIARVSSRSPRLVEIAFRERGDRLWAALYRHGRPIQYAYTAAPLALWHVQTRWAARPVCAEMPSAGRPLAWEVLIALARRGVAVASLTHAAGISSTGDPELDALLPMPERYEIPEATVRAIAETKARGGRVIAVGTTVARALEGAAAAGGGALGAGAGTTDLVLTAAFRPRIVDGLFSGVHEPGESHYRLLQAFAPPALLDRAHAHAEEAGYLTHEFGDSTLILS